MRRGLSREAGGMDPVQASAPATGSNPSTGGRLSVASRAVPPGLTTSTPSVISFPIRATRGLTATSQTCGAGGVSG